MINPLTKPVFSKAWTAYSSLPTQREESFSLFEKVIQLDGERSLINISPCHFALSVEELA